MQHCQGEQADAAMSVLGVVPGEEGVAEGPRRLVGGEARRDVGRIPEGLNPASEGRSSVETWCRLLVGVPPR